MYRLNAFERPDDLFDLGGGNLITRVTLASALIAAGDLTPQGLLPAPAGFARRWINVV